jgi:Mn2+/Fe2+ NRAMP family transporter
MMVAALLVADYRKGELDTNSTLFKVLAAVACCFGLTVPILGVQPIAAQIVTQIAAVFVLPLVILGIFLLVNRKDLMGVHSAGMILNSGLVGAFLFACLVSYSGAVALSRLF